MSGAFTVGFFVGRKDEEAIHVDDEPSFGDHVSEGVVHESLERGWRVCESKEHDHWFEEPFMGNKGSLPLMAIFDLDVVITPSDVKLGE